MVAHMPIYALGDLVPDIDESAYVAPEAVVIGNVTIGPESTVWPYAVLRGDDAAIRIGARTSVQDGVVIHTGPDIDTVVGDECTIGHLAHLEGPVIEDRALIGAGAIVLRQAHIGAMALVGAGALVPGGMEVPARAIAVGVPAKIRPDAVQDDMILPGLASYVARGHWYRKDLRRLDD
jgi:carbonic anhydrase/acetyltransferase-like protein (isoleucine patch superfamily)